MFGRALLVPMGMVAIAAMAATPLDGQLSGRVVLREGPIAVDVVFGPRHARTERYRVVHREVHVPVRYRAGMSVWELERYLERIEYEYEYFRQLHPRDAYYEYGWTRDELRSYVRFLRDERRFLRAERERLYELHRADRDRWERPGRGGGRGRGEGLGRGRGRGNG